MHGAEKHGNRKEKGVYTLMAFRGRRRLERFHLHTLQDVGTVIGEGFYAVVVEFQLHGLRCAGKKLHKQLCNSNPNEREGLLSRFEDECEMLSYVRHPNIVQFLGLSRDQETNTPILVMEYLETTLTACLKLHGVLPDEFNYSIISDIATGLCYLHGQAEPIIHRDLTPNNILLTLDMKAKIADLGMAKILNLNFVQRSQMTTCPGTQSYMPPEALSHDSNYDCTMDIFAMGILILHMFCGEWPVPGEANRVDPQNPSKLLPLTEAERREKFIAKLSSSHPLLSLIRQSLSNHPPHRPTAEQVLRANLQYSPPLLSKLDMATELKRVTADNEHLSQAYGNTSEQEMDLQTLRLTVEELTKEKEVLEKLLKIKEDVLAARGKELIAMRQQLEAKHEEAVAKEKELLVKEELIAAKGDTIKGLNEGRGLRLELNLKHCRQFPKYIIGNPNCTVFQGTLYVGAGVSHNDQDQYLIYSYDENSDNWNQLPPCPQKLFGLGHLPEGIVAVGGMTARNKITNEVYVFHFKKQVWRNHSPAMLTPRFRPTVITHSQAIAVCGGVNTDIKVCGEVEVFISGSSCWYSAPSLPVPCAIAKPLIIGDRCYLVGGYKQWRPPTATNTVQCAPLSGIFSATHRGNKETWSLLPDTPNDRPLPISIAGALVVIGGWNNHVSDAIYVFSEQANDWKKIGTWPTPFRSGGSATLSSGEVVVIGGLSGNGHDLFQVVIVSLKSV